MPHQHKRYDWRVRVLAALREYQAARLALDLLSEATAEQIHELAGEREWDDLAATEIYDAERNLDATYLIRMDSVFERAVGSFWRQLPGIVDLRVDGGVMLDEVGEARLIDEAVIESAQAVRIHRNTLVHRRIEDHAGVMAVEAASRDLLTYLEGLPATWG